MKQLLRKLFGGKDAPQPSRAPAPGSALDSARDSAPVSSPASGSPAKRDEAMPVVYVVSGLPRSGTSMMMKMLEAGGLPVMVDHQRTPDSDNPEGYYEFERVKEMDKGDTAWVAEAEGKVVKVIAALLEYLPPGYQYKVLFMHRRIDEVLASQRKMLIRRGEPTDTISDEEMARLFAAHVEKVKEWLAGQPNFAVLDVDYNTMLVDPLPQVTAINAFLGKILDEGKMAEVVNPTLYRNRA
jgi:hypothetical protein